MRIGNLIKEMRKINKMTQSELAEGICSSQYIYLVENNQRDPSAEIIDRISDKLNFDLYEYIPYLDYKNPRVVKSMLENFEKLRNNYNFELLYIETCNADKIEDFQTAPLKYELFINRIYLQIFKEENYENSCEQLKWMLEEANFVNNDGSINASKLTPQLARLYNMLFIALISYGKDVEAYETIDVLMRLIAPKKSMKKYHLLYISISLNYIETLYKRGIYDLHLSTCDDLINYQMALNLLDRIYLTYYQKAKALKRLGNDGSYLEYCKLYLIHGYSNGKQKAISLLNDEFIQMVEGNIDQFYIDLNNIYSSI